MGESSSNYYPSSRARGGSWYTPGALWLFSGDTEKLQLNDIWKYNISDNTWTWVRGDGTTNYGKIGIRNINNSISPRGWFTYAVDSKMNFWVFGGGDSVWVVINLILCSKIV